MKTKMNQHSKKFLMSKFVELPKGPSNSTPRVYLEELKARTRTRLVAARGRGEGQSSKCLMGTGCLLGVMKMFWS